MIKDILNKHEVNRSDIVYLLQVNEENELSLIFQKADKVREKYCGNEVHLRGIIEFSNYCAQDCLYCGLRKSNISLERYRMTKNEILQTAERIFKSEIKTIVLQSGEDFFLTGKDIADIICEIKNNFDVAITLSLGERDYEEYKLWRKAGADRYLLKHETANSKLYSVYHLGQKLQDRVQHLLYLKSLGYQIGSGNIVGLPAQNLEDIAGDILLCKCLDVDMASFSPFIPSPNTPYRKQKPCDVNFILKVMAITRIVLKNVHMPATTALASLYQEGREKGLSAGANVIMPNFTPAPYKEKFSIYINKKSDDDIMTQLTALISSTGRFISKEKGQTLKMH